MDRTMAHDVFISYSTKNQPIADAVYRELSDAGLRCWLAPQELETGTSWAAGIVEAIDASRVMVVILSQDADRSPQVLREVDRAVYKWLAIVAVKIEKFPLSPKMAYYLGPVHWLDATTLSLEQNLARLKADVVRLLASPQSVEAAPILSLSLPGWLMADFPLIGRTDEIRRMELAWRNALSGNAQAIVISGPAGSGKTRLVQEVVANHRSEYVGVLCARALSGTPAPYQAINDALRAVVDHNLILGLPEEAMVELRRLDSRAFPEVVPSEARQRREWALTLLFEALSRRMTTVLFIDDLQWTDHASLEFLQCLLLRNDQMRLLFIGTQRTDDYAAMTEPVTRLLDLCRRDHLLTEIDLKPLDWETSHSLLCSRLRLEAAPLFHDKLYDFTEGNPLYLLETLQALSDQGVIYMDDSGAPATDYDDIGYDQLPVPKSIQQAIQLRLSTLGESAVAFLNAAAIFGRQFDPDLVQQVAGLSDDQAISALDEIVQRGFVLEDKGLYDFNHGLLRETLTGALNVLKRKALHRKAFSVLSKNLRPAPSLTDVQQLALHADGGAVWPEAFRYALQAGLSTWELFDAATACHYLERAQTIARDQRIAIDPMDEMRLLMGLGDVHANLGKYDEARSQYQAVLSMVQGDECLIARLQWKIAITYQDQAQLDTAESWLDRAYALVQKGLDETLCAQICLQYGILCVRRGNLSEGLVWARRACAVESAQYHNLMAVLQRGFDNLEEALRHCEQAIVLAQRQNHQLDLAKAHANRGAVLSQMNRWQEAKQAHEQALEVLSATRDMRMYTGTHCNLSDVCRHLGDLERAQQLARTALRLATTWDLPFEQALAHLNLGEALLESGQSQQAYGKHLVMSRQILETQGIAYLRPEVERSIAEALLGLGELEQAEQVARASIQQAEKQGSGSDLGAGLRVLGTIERAQGRASTAEETLLRSAELLREHGPRFELGQTDVALASLLLDDPTRQAQAKSWLDEAEAIFTEAGAQRALAEVAVLRERLRPPSAAL